MAPSKTRDQRGFGERRKDLPEYHPACQLSAGGRSLVLHSESPNRRLFLVEIVFKVDLPQTGASERLQFFR